MASQKFGFVTVDPVAGKTTANGAIIADDPGAAGEFVWSITISDVPVNVTIELGCKWYSTDG